MGVAHILKDKATLELLNRMANSHCHIMAFVRGRSLIDARSCPEGGLMIPFVGGFHP